jgi:hypothetical protein
MKAIRFITFIIFILLTLLYLLIPAQAHAKGVLIKVEDFTPSGFNPQRDETSSLAFLVLKNSNITLRIFNFKGVRILEKKLGFFYDGRYKFVWDGLDLNDKIVQPGFYKFELIASELGYQPGDNDYAVVLIKPGVKNEKTASLSSILSKLERLPVEISGYIRSITEVDTGGTFNFDKKDIQFNLKGKNGENWKYDLRFFPYQNPSQPFNWSDFLEARAGYYTDKWNIETGYHNYMEGYDDPLNLFEDYKLGSDRISVISKMNFGREFNLNGAFHRIMSLNEYAFQAKSAYATSDGTVINGCTLNKFSNNYTNNVLGIWFNYPMLGAAYTILEVAGSLLTPSSGTTQQLSGYGVKAELKYDFLKVPEDYGRFGLLVGLELIEKNFTCDFADLPNGNDNYGIEVIIEYNKNFGLWWLNNLKFEVKKAYFRNIGNTQVKQKFRPTAIIELADGLNFSGHYDYNGTENITSAGEEPVKRLRYAYGELRYFKDQKKWDIYFSYTTSKTAADSFTDYTSTKASLGYHFDNSFFPYLGCEKIMNIVYDNFITNCYFWTSGFNWTIIPKYKTKIGLQAGYVSDNMPSMNGRWTYYGEISQYFLDRLNILVGYGSLTSIDPVPRFSAQFKFEF